MFRHFKSWLVGEEERMRRRGGWGIIHFRFVYIKVYIFVQPWRYNTKPPWC